MKTFLDKVCIYSLQLVDSSISPGWLFLVHVQCSAEIVKKPQFYWQILLPIDKNLGLQEVLFKNELALKWRKIFLQKQMQKYLSTI